MEVKFSAPVLTVPKAHPASYIMGTGSFQGVKRPERGVNDPLHIVSRLKKGSSQTSTPTVCIHERSESELQLAIYKNKYHFREKLNSNEEP